MGIAIWEEERHQVHGGALVAELEAEARTAGVGMMYVEIGFEQPKARRFWGKQGFARIVRPDAQETLLPDISEGVGQRISLPEEQMVFFENNCLRFSDTAQYV